MLQNLLFSLICLIILSCKTPAAAQQNNSWAGQNAAPQQSGQNAQNNSWQAPGQSQWQSGGQQGGQQGAQQGGWQPLGGAGSGNSNANDNQAGPAFFGNATTTQANEQLQEPGAYLNQAAPNNGFTDTLSTNSGSPSGQQNNQGTNNNTGNAPQQGKVKKNHEGLKSALTGMGRAFETAATVAAPIAGGYMIGKAMQSGYGSPYGMGGYGMSPYGGYGSPYGMGMGGYGMSPYGGYGGYPMGGYGMPMMNPGMSSFLHY